MNKLLNYLQNKKKIFLNLASFFLICFILIELLSFTFFKIGDNANLSVVSTRIYTKPTVNEIAVNDYLDKRNPLLGWPEKNIKIDQARFSPANEKMLDQDLLCVSLYGPSHVYGDEVADNLAWSNLLTLKLQCKVNNFGIGGYGVDQSLMKFESSFKDSSVLTILGITPIIILRNMTQWQYLLSGSKSDLYSLKPSYRENDGELKLLPIPVNSFHDFTKLINDPSDMLLNEYFIPEKNLQSPIIANFPYTIAFIKLAKKLLNEIDWGQLSAHTPVRNWNIAKWKMSDSYINRNNLIMEKFFKICKERKKICKILMIPDEYTLLEYKKNQSLALEPIYSKIKEENVWDPTKFFINKIEEQQKDFCEFIAINQKDCSGHYSELGNELLAEYVYSKILHELWEEMWSKKPQSSKNLLEVELIDKSDDE